MTNFGRDENLHNGLKCELIATIETGGAYALDWRETNRGLTEEDVAFEQHLYQAYRIDADVALFELGATPKTVELSDSLEYLYRMAATFVKNLARNPALETLREKATAEMEAEEREALLTAAPYLNGMEHLNSRWLELVWTRLNQAFAKAVQKHPGSVAEYLSDRNPELHFAGKVYFHLVESNQGDFPFAFLATYAVEMSVTGKARHLPLKNALLEYGENSQKLLELLSTVNKAAGRSPFVAELLETGELFHPIGLNPNEAYTFLKEVPLYEEAGILCRIPNWWRHKTDSMKVVVRLGAKAPSFVGLDALMDFNAQLALDGATITAEELQKLLAQSEGLAFIKGKWVAVDHQRLRETLAAYEQACKMAQKGDLTLAEALRMRLWTAKSMNLKENSCEVEVTHGEWLEKVLSQLGRIDTMETVSCGADFKGTLREYQQKGLGWLSTMKSLGLGACLADDMGLGKTIQVIALLNHIRTVKEEKTLLIVPASLIGNWTAEIDRFAPCLPYHLLHSQGMKNTVQQQDLAGAVCITTYGMVVRTDWLKAIEWDLVIVDEAQAIKNPGSKQSKAVNQLRAHSRIAMTGTPVENRLSDLWSIFDFLNKGILGSAKEFTTFTKKIQESKNGYAKLKQVVAPFILRRLKTDQSIITDLPEKIEMKVYATLTKKQAALYGSMVAELQSKLESSAGIERKGLVLAALMKFKQLCNHPDQYLGQEAYAENESGKYERLRAICETIYEKRERVLVFTQFKEITAPLAAFLKTIFHQEGLVLHGETPVAKRKDLVAEFQGHEYVPFMVLSLKAGGVGLNLTAANHVIHFDRWWNPAVENQATDRAFRIGQRKNVLVHKFITKGTVEEKIDRMIGEKTKMSQEIMADMHEGWITEMDNGQLMELFKLTI